METHGDSAVGIACVNKVLGKVKSVLNQSCEGVVRLLVDEVGAPIGECLELLLGNVVGKNGGVMALHHQLEAVAAAGDVGLHSVPYQNILQLGTQVKTAWVCILSN